MVYLKQIKHLNLELPTNHQIENFAIYISQCFRWDKDASIFNGLFIIPIVDNSEGLRLIQQDSPYYYGPIYSKGQYQELFGNLNFIICRIKSKEPISGVMYPHVKIPMKKMWSGGFNILDIPDYIINECGTKVYAYLDSCRYRHFKMHCFRYGYKFTNEYDLIEKGVPHEDADLLKQYIDTSKQVNKLYYKLAEESQICLHKYEKREVVFCKNKFKQHNLKPEMLFDIESMNDEEKQYVKLFIKQENVYDALRTRLLTRLTDATFKMINFIQEYTL